MRLIKKYFSILFVLSVFPVAWLTGTNFVTYSDTDIYDFIPQESDIVIEVNNVNFISEIAYQRIYNQDYVLDQIDMDEVETETGIDYFSKIVLFREQWANEYVWFAVLKYRNRKKIENYIKTKMKNTNMAFGNGHVVVQLSESQNQDEMNKRLASIAGKKVKPFTARVNLFEVFKPDKEINAYFIPPTGEYQNQIIEGYLSFDFKKEHVVIDGEFTPIGGFENTPSVAYALNEEAAFSMRSSMNIFNSIYWFSKEKIDNIPEYSQLALDYDGMNMFMVDLSFGYDFPFKKFPEMDLRFDIVDTENWHTFYDSALARGKIRVDTTTNLLATKEGTFFKVNFTDDVFELGKKENVSFESSSDPNVCFDLQFRIPRLIDNTKFLVDEDNPPSETLRLMVMAVANDMMEDMRVMANVDQIKFKLLKDGPDKIKAEGKVSMVNKNGRSEIECLLFTKESIYFISQALEVMSDM